MKSKTLRFEALTAQQGSDRKVVMIRATAAQIHQIAAIERLGRDETGHLVGFQRPQVAGHIREIREYLEQTEAVLPNALVLAFVGSARLVESSGGKATLEVDVSGDAPGYVVDGQQRLTALTATGREDFEVFASCLICNDLDELRRQFILINNTKPLAKSLIYELLPTVNQLPERLTSRALASAITEQLNFVESSSLHRKIKMQTNPTGLIKDTVLQKAIMNSESAGAVQIVMSDSNGAGMAAAMISNFYEAVQSVFHDEWHGHKAATSRLVHGAGIIAMGYVMDEIYARKHTYSVEAFVDGLKPLVGRTAWTQGQWQFSADEIVPWDHIENTPRQMMQLASHLVGLLRVPARPKRQTRAAHQ